MSIPEALLGFAAVAALLTIIPGLDTALVLRAALTQSRGVAIATALGICSGALVWGGAAAVGAAALLAASEIAFMALKIVGAAYMIYLGVSMLVASIRRPRGNRVVAPPTSSSRATAFGRGALTNLLNPKVGVFYVALIPQFLPAGVPALPMGLALAMVHILMSVVWFGLIIVGSTVARRWLASDTAKRWIDRVTGTVLIGFGVALVVEARPFSHALG